MCFDRSYLRNPALDHFPRVPLRVRSRLGRLRISPVVQCLDNRSSGGGLGRLRHHEWRPCHRLVQFPLGKTATPGRGHDGLEPDGHCLWTARWRRFYPGHHLAMVYVLTYHSDPDIG